MIGSLPEAAYSGFTAEHIANITDPNVASFFVASLPASSGAMFTSEDIAAMDPTAFGGFSVSHINNMDPEAFGGITAEHLEVLGPASLPGYGTDIFTSFTADQIANLSPEAMGADNIVNMIGSLPEAAYSGFTAEHIENFEISPELLMTPSYEDIMTFQPDTLEAFEDAWNSASNTNFSDYLQSISNGQSSSLSQLFDIPEENTSESTEESAENNTEQTSSEGETVSPNSADVASEAVTEQQQNDDMSQFATEESTQEVASEPAEEETPEPVQTATEDSTQEVASEPAEKETPEPVQTATEESTQEVAIEPAKEGTPETEQTAAKNMAAQEKRSEDNDRDPVRGMRERDNRDDDRDSVRGMRERDDESEWGESANLIAGLKPSFLNNKEELIPKHNDLLTQGKNESSEKSATPSELSEAEKLVIANMDKLAAKEFMNNLKGHDSISDDGDNAFDMKSEKQSENNDIV